MFDFIKKIFKAGESPKNGFIYDEKDTVVIYLKCKKCGEIIRSHLRKSYDFSRDFEKSTINLKKEYIGSKCYEKIFVNLVFNNNYKIISSEIINGEFISKEDFESNARS
jgi:hypothetical protein